MILHKHESTGGLVVLRKLKAGYTIPAHTRPKANERAYVLSGEWEESSTTPRARCSLRPQARVIVRTSRAQT